MWVEREIYPYKGNAVSRVTSNRDMTNLIHWIWIGEDVPLTDITQLEGIKKV